MKSGMLYTISIRRKDKIILYSKIIRNAFRAIMSMFLEKIEIRNNGF